MTRKLRAKLDRTYTRRDYGWPTKYDRAREKEREKEMVWRKVQAEAIAKARITTTRIKEDKPKPYSIWEKLIKPKETK